MADKNLIVPVDTPQRLFDENEADLEQIRKILNNQNPLWKMPYKNILILASSGGEIATLKPIIENLLINNNNPDFKITVMSHHFAYYRIEEYIDQIRELLPEDKQDALIFKEMDDRYFGFVWEYDYMITGLFHEKNHDYISEASKRRIPIAGIVDLTLPDQSKRPIFYNLIYTIITDDNFMNNRIVVTNEHPKNELVEYLENAGFYDKEKSIKIGTDPKLFSALKFVHDFRTSSEYQARRSEIQARYYPTDAAAFNSFSAAESQYLNICFSGQNINQKNTFKILAQALEMLQKNKLGLKINLVYLPHPGDIEYDNDGHPNYDAAESRFADLRSAFSEMANIHLTFSYDNSYEVGAVADVALAETSTLGIELAYAGIPALFITDPDPDKHFLIEAFAKGNVIRVQDPEFIWQYLNNLKEIDPETGIYYDRNHEKDGLRSSLLEYIRALGLIQKGK
jgi:hypothetical protein